MNIPVTKKKGTVVSRLNTWEVKTLGERSSTFSPVEKSGKSGRTQQGVGSKQRQRPKRPEKKGIDQKWDDIVVGGQIRKGGVSARSKNSKK